MPGFTRKPKSKIQVQALGPAGNTSQVSDDKVASAGSNPNQNSVRTQTQSSNNNVIANGVNNDAVRSITIPNISDIILGSADQKQSVTDLAAVTTTNLSIAPLANQTQQRNNVSAGNVVTSTLAQSPSTSSVSPNLTASAASQAVRGSTLARPQGNTGRNFGSVNIDGLVAAVRGSSRNPESSRPGNTYNRGTNVSPLRGVATDLRPIQPNAIAEVLQNNSLTTGSPTAVTPSAEPRPASATTSSAAANNRIGHLPSSNVDFYLREVGLTSLYPAIIMTAKRDQTQFGNIDPASFFIDMNGKIKSQIEREVSNILRGKDDSAYTQKVQLARTYADLCLGTSLKKDLLISLLNVANTTIEASQLSGRTGKKDIGGQYSPLSGRNTVARALQAKNSNYPTDVFTKGTNTHSILQFLKTLYFTMLYGGIEFRPTDKPVNTGTLYGSVPQNLSSALNDLNTISLRGIVDPITTNLLNNNQPVVNMSNFNLGSDITSVLAYITHDVMIQARKSSLQAVSQGSNFSRSLGNIIGVYTGEEIPEDNVSSAITSVTDFLRVGNTGQIDPILTRTIGRNKFSVLDTNTQTVSTSVASQRKTGVDYLVYDDMINDLEFKNCKSFVNQYDSDIATKVYDLWSLAFDGPNSIRSAFAQKITDQFKSWITATKITQRDKVDDNKASYFRTVCLFRAASPGQSKFALKLFRLICALDKLNDESTTPNLTTRRTTSLNTEIDKAANAVVADFFLSSPEYKTYRNFQSDMQIDQGQLSSVTKDVDSDLNDFIKALKPTGLNSFLQFHRAVRDFENLLSVNKSTSSIIDINNMTEYGFNKSRDSRAFVVYTMFLSLLKQTQFEVIKTTLTKKDKTVIPIVDLRFSPDHFKAILSALNNISKTPREYEDYLQRLETNDSLFLGVVTGANIRQQTFSNCKLIFGSHVHPMVRKVYDFERSSYDLVTILNLHSAQLKTATDSFIASIGAVSNSIANNDLTDVESIINSTQREQAQLKKINVEKYSNRLIGAQYLPSISDYNLKLAVYTKVVLRTHPRMRAGPKKNYIAIGLPSGLLENLRYQNVLSTAEDIFNIRLNFVNLQVKQLADGLERIQRTYKFSSKLFVFDKNDDRTVNKPRSYNDVFSDTGLKYFGDDGSVRDISYADASRILGQEIVDNHMLSHYAQAALRMINGIRIDEGIFDMRERSQVFPDVEKMSEYLTIFRDYVLTRQVKDTTDEKLFLQRVMNDVARSTYLSPNEHFISMATSRKFERVYIIPVTMSSNDGFLSENVTFPTTFADIVLESKA